MALTTLLRIAFETVKPYLSVQEVDTLEGGTRRSIMPLSLHRQHFLLLARSLSMRKNEEIVRGRDSRPSSHAPFQQSTIGIILKDSSITTPIQALSPDRRRTDGRNPQTNNCTHAHASSLRQIRMPSSPPPTIKSLRSEKSTFGRKEVKKPLKNY